ncbi:MAG: hypothetical protein U1E29_10495 [Coriobacteriia bacterium]|nr:hypothetical protein [Coriobacteriia bacterium]
MRAEHVEAMERSDALTNEPRRRGRNFGRSFTLPLLGLGTVALIFWLVSIGRPVLALIVPLGVFVVARLFGDRFRW